MLEELNGRTDVDFVTVIVKLRLPRSKVPCSTAAGVDGWRLGAPVTGSTRNSTW